ncbi:YacL family protein [Shewanella aestuarii]|uniref:YacL family protein n=1 Tax=Shewanella aestuarii TaxID=1028752 RepID=A0A6G9QNB1_9GAMM|nr:YacL family protein [Shewanella aestuarii]QIR15555.1 YacL family protein [Shewanella aestuarii]
MEYEFRRNRLDGTVFANFSMEHEVFGRWFAEELGDDAARAKSILTDIAQLVSKQRSQWRDIGQDLTIDADNEQVRIFVNAIDFEEEHDFEEGMGLYDAESEGFCGLEDFETALTSWLKFIQE